MVSSKVSTERQEFKWLKFIVEIANFTDTARVDLRKKLLNETTSDNFFKTLNHLLAKNYTEYSKEISGGFLKKLTWQPGLFFKGSKLREKLVQARNEIGIPIETNSEKGTGKLEKQAKKHIRFLDVMIAGNVLNVTDKDCSVEEFLERANDNEQNGYPELAVYYYIKYIETMLESNEPDFSKIVAAKEIIDRYREDTSDFYLQCINILEDRIAEKYADYLFEAIKGEPSATAVDGENIIQLLQNPPSITSSATQDRINKLINVYPQLNYQCISTLFKKNICTFLKTAVYDKKNEDQVIKKKKNDIYYSEWKKNTMPSHFLENHDTLDSKLTNNTIISVGQKIEQVFYNDDCTEILPPSCVTGSKLSQAFNSEKSSLNQREMLYRIIRWVRQFFMFNTDNNIDTSAQVFVNSGKKAGYDKPVSVLDMAKEKFQSELKQYREYAYKITYPQTQNSLAKN